MYYGILKTSIIDACFLKTSIILLPYRTLIMELSQRMRFLGIEMNFLDQKI